MRWNADRDNAQAPYFVIRQDMSAGFYLHLYWGEFDLIDHLQDSLAEVMEQAQDDFGVPKSAWRPVGDQANRWGAVDAVSWRMRAVIETDADSKFHLRVFGNGQTLYDFSMQDLQVAQTFACEKLNIPSEFWVKEL
ncbi:MAG: hypothetical protein WBK91_05580 [Alphaproteobacteria bacterium]